MKIPCLMGNLRHGCPAVLRVPVVHNPLFKNYNPLCNDGFRMQLQCFQFNFKKRELVWVHSLAHVA